MVKCSVWFGDIKQEANIEVCSVARISEKARLHYRVYSKENE